MLAVVRWVTVEVHQLGITPYTRCDFTSVELARLIERLENHLLCRQRSVIEGRLHRVKVMCANSDEIATSTNVEVQLVLEIEEARVKQ